MASWLLEIVFLCTLIVGSRGQFYDKYRCPAVNTFGNEYYRTHANKCYLFVQTEVHWTTARDYCFSRGGHMVFIQDQATQNFIKNSLRNLNWNYNGVWLGLHDRDREGHWTWLTGEPVSYNNWAPGEPEDCFFPCLHDCAQLRTDNHYMWQEQLCGVFPYSYICQFNMGPATTTTTTTTTPTTTTTTTQAPTRTPSTTQTIAQTETTDNTFTTAETTTTVASNGVQDAMKQETQGTATGAVVGTVLGVLLAVFLIVAGFIFVHRRKCSEKKEKESTDVPMSFDNVAYSVSQGTVTTGGVMATYQNTFNNARLQEASSSQSPSLHFVKKYDNIEAANYAELQQKESPHGYDTCKQVDEACCSNADNAIGGACAAYDTVELTPNKNVYDDINDHQPNDVTYSKTSNDLSDLPNGDINHAYTEVASGDEARATQGRENVYEQVQNMNKTTEDYLREFDLSELNKSTLTFTNNIYSVKNPEP